MKTLSLKLPIGLAIKLDRAAKTSGLTESEVVRAALERFLQNERPASALELAGDLVGGAEGPEDLSTNPKYMNGYGE